MKYKHIPANPATMQPKQTFHEEVHQDFYVSPRKFIRYVQNRGSNFTYCENFMIHSLFTITQLEELKCKIEVEFRLEILKPIRLI